ncbi:MAG TPA: WYL domain-containing protein [Gammaproteobacteria bacterium]|nr:WYL domain-containing protein [Gammaproteobacteria bacterium]
MIRDEIVKAIEAHAIVAFNYHGRRRVVEPHDLGVLHGETQLLAYQVEGGSRSGGIPEWRRFDLDDVENLTLTGRCFGAPRRDWIRRKPRWDRRIAAVH